MLASRIRVSTIAALVTLGAAALAFGEGADASGPSKKVNINTASPVELAYLPRIGARVAERIVERRKEKPFARPEELMEVKGIGEKLFTSLKPYLATSGATTLSEKVSSKGTRGGSSGTTRATRSAARNSVPVGKGR